MIQETEPASQIQLRPVCSWGLHYLKWFYPGLPEGRGPNWLNLTFSLKLFMFYSYSIGHLKEKCFSTFWVLTPCSNISYFLGNNISSYGGEEGIVLISPRPLSPWSLWSLSSSKDVFLGAPLQLLCLGLSVLLNPGTLPFSFSQISLSPILLIHVLTLLWPGSRAVGVLLKRRDTWFVFSYTFIPPSLPFFPLSFPLLPLGFSISFLRPPSSSHSSLP